MAMPTHGFGSLTPTSIDSTGSVVALLTALLSNVEGNTDQFNSVNYVIMYLYGHQQTT
jgi:hypothetical protein